MSDKTLNLQSETQTLELGTALAAIVRPPLVIHLEGELGAGKTTLSRALVQGLGHQGHVKSPTYTLVEPYELDEISVYHFDLYRLADPEELEFMGIRDYFSDQSLCLVEWPSKGQGVLPPADLTITLSYQGEGRCVTLSSHSTKGEAILEQL
ncbi:MULTISPECIES: tRNA (adenosine(37)-N6)-threonylcarbamoyltransferase complex ATPase subunit type 1 TsaE [Ferrimonas]|uniref:tRNA (adenosine(37)-N6)-threonylcarbamoyltransferase complex ATPase subunit type 1 TsaE n=1 Tax=Ferrimonas TaxID=44011 RepID=UPI0004290A68|nr:MULTISPECIES: tRNA (adenosine(37)-N6)-threonylcarbamoyltransferase complex ATPase subunit type 1 TsaE [Ferrimonas]USD37098.1 tRNA (adenosine(37)-N6)-threonylcarbamoyltransferase complex ATPase subunit type 1 TsaE [Ferrimonas sp. SCSIO 43195]